jgi:RimJ/RimL family protein N-acetyltransferase
MSYTQRTYKIITDRLVVRCYKPGDAPMLKKAIDESLPELRLWMPWAIAEPEPLENKQARLSNIERQFVEGTDFMFGVFSLNETEVLASTGLHTRLEDDAREIGYWVHSHHARRGIATEIVQALMKVAFEIENLQRLEIRCDERNIASYRVAKKAGFTLKEVLPYNMKDVNGVFRNTMVWEMTADKYRKLRLPNLQLVAFDKAGLEIPLFA